jgi:hypothetical protein
MFCIPLLLIPFAVTGCPGKSDEGTTKLNAPIDNTSAAAKSTGPDTSGDPNAPALGAKGGMKKGGAR